jgi:16S rRNA (guanine1207-N2)-methyltransferase
MPAQAYVYGSAPPGLAEVPPGAVQVSPLAPGAEALEEAEPGAAGAVLIAAPPGTIERRYVLALALRALAPGGELVALGPKEKGGSRLRKELEAFGCEVAETSRAHQRICRVARPDAPAGLEAAIAAGAPQRLPGAGLWTQPGVFSWDRPDPGTEALAARLPALAGRGADLGCGIGVLALRVLGSADVTHLDLVDVDRRAIQAARRNVEDARAAFHWADARTDPDLHELDFVVMNPPFHEQGREDRGLGRNFIRAAHAMLKRGGALWLVANRRLPYEGELDALFTQAASRGEGGGYKVIEARK